MYNLKFVNILEVDEALQEKVRQWRNRDDIRRNMLDQHIISKDEHASWLESLAQKDISKFYVVFADDLAMGAVYLQHINYKDLTTEWGFYIGEVGYRGKGLGKIILLRLLHIVFEDMKFRTIYTNVLSYNTIVLNLCNRFNFRETSRAIVEGSREIVHLEFSYKDWVGLNEDAVLKNKKKNA